MSARAKLSLLCRLALVIAVTGVCSVQITAQFANRVTVANEKRDVVAENIDMVVRAAILGAKAAGFSEVRPARGQKGLVNRVTGEYPTLVTEIKQVWSCARRAYPSGGCLDCSTRESGSSTSEGRFALYVELKPADKGKIRVEAEIWPAASTWRATGDFRDCHETFSTYAFSRSVGAAELKAFLNALETNLLKPELLSTVNADVPLPHSARPIFQPTDNYSVSALQRTMRIDSGVVSALAFSPDSRYLAGAAEGVKLWERETGVAPKRQPIGSGGTNTALAYAPDGRSIAVGTLAKGYSEVTVFDTASMKSRSSLRLHDSSVYSLAYSPDGSMLACGTNDGTVYLWNARTSDLIRKVGPAQGALFASVAFSPDSRTLAVGSHGQAVRLYDVTSGALKLRITPEAWSVAAVTFSPDGRLLAVAPFKGLWDAHTGESRGMLDPKAGGEKMLAFSPDGRMLASADDSRTVKVWDVGAKKLLGELTVSDSNDYDRVRTLAFAPDGRTLATGGSVVRLWDVSKLGTPSALPPVVSMPARQSQQQEAVRSVEGTSWERTVLNESQSATGNEAYQFLQGGQLRHLYNRSDPAEQHVSKGTWRQEGNKVFIDYTIYTGVRMTVEAEVSGDSMNCSSIIFFADRKENWDFTLTRKPQ